MTESAVPSGGRWCHGESSWRGRRRWSGGSGDRKPKGVKGPGAVTSEKWTPGSQILHRKTRSVKFHITRIVSCQGRRSPRQRSRGYGARSRRWAARQSSGSCTLWWRRGETRRSRGDRKPNQS
jgi:hypothetical protein